jgi:hypothetical protein
LSPVRTSRSVAILQLNNTVLLRGIRRRPGETADKLRKPDYVGQASRRYRKLQRVRPWANLKWVVPEKWLVEADTDSQRYLLPPITHHRFFALRPPAF